MSILICKECGFEIGEHTTETDKINGSVTTNG